MTKTDLMKRLEAEVDEAIRTQMWGTLGVSFSGGTPVILRKELTTKLGEHRPTHANKLQRQS